MILNFINYKLFLLKKSMRKISFIFLFSVLQVTVLSQKVETGFYASYSFSIQNSFIGMQQKTVNGNLLSISNIRGSLASGLNYGIFTHLNIHEHVKLVLSYNFLNSSNTLFSTIEEENSVSELTGKAKQESFSPGFIFHFPMKKITFFSKNCLIIPLKTRSEFSKIQVDKNSQEIYRQLESIDYAFNFGFKNAIGSEIQVNKSFKIAISLESSILNLSSKFSEIIFASSNGQETTNSLTTYGKKTDYFNNLNNFSNNEDYNEMYDLNKNKEELSFSHNFSNFETRISLIYVFQNKKIEKK
jgi:hypothetical protein